MVEDISFVNRKFGAEPKRCPQGLYDPRPVFLRKTTNSDLKEFEDELNLLPTSCGFLHLLSKAGDDVAKSSQAALLLLPRSVKAQVTSTLLEIIFTSILIIFCKKLVIILLQGLPLPKSSRI